MQQRIISELCDWRCGYQIFVESIVPMQHEDTWRNSAFDTSRFIHCLSLRGATGQARLCTPFHVIGMSSPPLSCLLWCFAECLELCPSPGTGPCAGTPVGQTKTQPCAWQCALRGSHSTARPWSVLRCGSRSLRRAPGMVWDMEQSCSS